MKNLFLILAVSLSFSFSANAGEWWNMTHSLNEVSLLDCRLLKKKSGHKQWKRIATISDYHSGKNDRKFSYQLMLHDAFGTDRYLVLKFELNSWDYEIEDPETGEWKTYNRRGVTSITFQIEDRHVLSTDIVRSHGPSTRDLEQTKLNLYESKTRASYKFTCDERM